VSSQTIVHLGYSRRSSLRCPASSDATGTYDCSRTRRIAKGRDKPTHAIILAPGSTGTRLARAVQRFSLFRIDSTYACLKNSRCIIHDHRRSATTGGARALA